MSSPADPALTEGTVAIRIGVMSDLHIEFEAAYWQQVERAARRGDSSRAADALRRRAELRNESGHPERGPDLRGLKASGVDLLLLPGDIHLGTDGIAYADAAAQYLGCRVCTSIGNHECYRHDLLRLLPKLRQTAAGTDGRVSFLERDRVDITVRDRRAVVLGATLWTDYTVNGNKPLAMLVAEEQMNDHRLIRYRGKRFSPGHAQALHAGTRDWLGREAPRARAEADVVVIMTHHAPLLEANPPHYRGGALAPAFVSDLRQEILEWQPDVWVWGHTHFSLQTQVGRTKCVSAQRGYIGDEDGADTFVPLVVEV